MEALGVEMLLKVRIGDTMTTVAGLTTDQVVIDNESIDITNKGCFSWRTLLAGGKRTVDITASAYVLDDAAQTLLKQSHIDNVSLVCELTDGIDSGFSGTFLIGSLEENGSYDGAEELSITLHSTSIVGTTQIYSQTWYLYVTIEWCVLSGMGLSGDVPAAVLVAFATYGGQIYAGFTSGIAGVEQSAIISFGPQPQLLTGDLTIYGAAVDSCTPASNPFAALTIPVSSVSVPVSGAAVATSTGATYTPMSAAGAVSGWMIDVLNNYDLRPATGARRVTTFTSQTL